MSTFDLLQQQRTSATAAAQGFDNAPRLVVTWYSPHLQQWLDAALYNTGELDAECCGRSRCPGSEAAAPQRKLPNDEDDVSWGDTPPLSSSSAMRTDSERLKKFLGLSHRGLCGAPLHRPHLASIALPAMSPEHREEVHRDLAQVVYLTVSHRLYSNRKVLLDEVAAYSAARTLYAGFIEAFTTSLARQAKSGSRAVAGSPDQLQFSDFVGVLSAGEHLPLRRVDSSDWSAQHLDVSAINEAVQPLGADTRTRDVAAAFLHHSWAVGSGRRCMCEVKLCLGELALVVAVHTNSAVEPAADAPFGTTLNGQRAAISKLIFAHRCNAFCRQLGLTPLAPLV